MAGRVGSCQHRTGRRQPLNLSIKMGFCEAEGKQHSRNGNSAVNRFWATVGAVALLAGFMVGVTYTPAQAAGPPKEWFIAQSGTANPNGASCADPTVVGSDDTAIRTALDAVSADDTITICSGTYDITQTLIVDDSITIQGDDTAGASILDGGDAVQIMRINDDDSTPDDPLEVEVSITDLSFQNGNTGPNGTDSCNTESQCGGAIYVEHQSSLTVKRSIFVDNYASFLGGAIGAWGENNRAGTIDVHDSTFVNNVANFDGGAIAIAFNNSLHLTVLNSTFVGNQALIRSGGAVNASFSLGSVTASTFVDNSAGNLKAIGHNMNVTGSILTGGIGSSLCGSSNFNANATNVATEACDDATVVTAESLNLRGLGSWGGPTETVWIGPGSSAIDANTGTCQTFDQRGASRSSSPCDAGAFERQGSADEATTGTLDYPVTVLVGSSASPVSSPSFSGGGRTIGYMSLTLEQCSVDQATGVASGVAAGECRPQWFVAPTLILDGAAHDDTLTVQWPAQAVLTITSGTGPIPPGHTLTLTTSGGSGSGAVSFNASPASACSVTGTTLTAVDSGTCQVSATKAGDDTYLPATSAIVLVQVLAANPPTPVFPPSAPQSVTGMAGDASADISWVAPASSGSFPVSNYQVVLSPGGKTCLTAAPTVTCTVTGLSNGTVYTATARALNGAGWGPYSAASNSFTPQNAVTRSITITGTRGDVRGIPGIIVNGTTQGFEPGAILTPWIRFPGQTTYSAGRARILVNQDGDFTWQRRTNKKIYVSIRNADGTMKSNRLIIDAR